MYFSPYTQPFWPVKSAPWNQSLVNKNDLVINNKFLLIKFLAKLINDDDGLTEVGRQAGDQASRSTDSEILEIIKLIIKLIKLIIFKIN